MAELQHRVRVGVSQSSLGQVVQCHDYHTASASAQLCWLTSSYEIRDRKRRSLLPLVSVPTVVNGRPRDGCLNFRINRLSFGAVGIGTVITYTYVFVSLLKDTHTHTHTHTLADRSSRGMPFARLHMFVLIVSSFAATGGPALIRRIAGTLGPRFCTTLTLVLHP